MQEGQTQGTTRCSAVKPESGDRGQIRTTPPLSRFCIWLTHSPVAVNPPAPPSRHLRPLRSLSLPLFLSPLYPVLVNSSF